MATSEKEELYSDTYLGTWRIVECVSLAGTVDTTGIEGCEFQLDDNGDVNWKLPEGTDCIPFFSSDKYELVKRLSVHRMKPQDSVLLKFFGTYAEHIIEFKAEISDDLMLLTCERCCILQCQKIKNETVTFDDPYSLLSAFEEGYFSDLTIKAENGKSFRVHSLILQLSAPEIDWSCIVPPLSGLREDVLSTVLYYLYTECLPKGLSEDTASACIKLVGKLPGLKNFSQSCEAFLRNTELRHQIINLIDDMHACADRIIEMFKCKKQNVDGFRPQDVLAANPPKLCYVIKQAAREGAVACSKLVILFDLFARRSRELPQEERHDIIKYARSRLPIFIRQLHELFEYFKLQLNFMSYEQKQDIATYILPEVETSITMLTTLVEEFQEALDKAISTNISEKEKSEKKEKQKIEHVKDVLGKTLKNALHVRELQKLRSMQDFISIKLETFLETMQNFDRKSRAVKIMRILLLIDALKDREVQIFLDRIHQLSQALDDKFKWKEWKYLFKFGSSKVAWCVSKLRSYQTTLYPSTERLVDLINREEFTASITALGLWKTEKNGGVNESLSTTNLPGANKQTEVQPQMKYVQLSSIESLCIPPKASTSVLAKKTLELFKTKEKTDMVFEIILVHDIGDIVIDHTHGEPRERQESDRDVETYQIPAHCVILAARCNWFSRALLSGMRESIDKKITIHDTNPDVFCMFLEFLYSGQLNSNSLSTEHLTELLTLADRYEVDSLKGLCEYKLQQHVDKDTCVYLLSLADQLHSKSLKDKVLSFMVENSELTEDDEYLQLPPHLKAEVEDAILEDNYNNGFHSQAHTKTSSPSSVDVVEDMVNRVDLSSRRYSSSSSSSSSSEFQTVIDRQRLEECMTAVREVIGDDVPEDDLVQFVLAADYDVSRAINFYLQS